MPYFYSDKLKASSTGLPARLCLFFLFLSLDLAQALPIFTHIGVRPLYTAVLEPSVSMGDSAASLYGIFPGWQRGIIEGALTANFIIERSEDTRALGWTWGIALGSHSPAYKNTKFFQPASYFWELIFGRGTDQVLISGDTGLRGYFEVGLRDEQPQKTPELRTRLTELGRSSFLDHNLALNFRMGASNDPASGGLVDQKAPSIAYGFFGGFMVPLGTAQVSAFYLETRAATTCGSENFYCALNLRLLRSQGAASNALSEALKYEWDLGPEFTWKIAIQETKTFLLKGSLIWNIFLGPNSRYAPPDPQVKLLVQYTF